MSVQQNTHGRTSSLNGEVAKNLVAALADEASRRILSSTLIEGKTVQEISLEQALPFSTCYRRAHELVHQGLLGVERIVVTGDGRRFHKYRSFFRSVQITSSFGDVSVAAELNAGMEENYRETQMRPKYPLYAGDLPTWSA